MNMLHYFTGELKRASIIGIYNKASREEKLKILKSLFRCCFIAFLWTLLVMGLVFGAIILLRYVQGNDLELWRLLNKNALLGFSIFYLPWAMYMFFIRLTIHKTFLNVYKREFPFFRSPFVCIKPYIKTNYIGVPDSNKGCGGVNESYI